MNDDRNFEARKPMLLQLLELKLPHEVIEKMLDISVSTFNNYQNRLKNEKEFIHPLSQYSKRESVMLKVFADLKTSPRSLNLPKEFEDQLVNTLAEIIDEADILRVIKCSMPALLSFQKRRYDERVPTEYQKLIDDVCGDHLGLSKECFKDTDSHAEYQWKKYLKDISNETTPIPINVKFDWKKNHFVRDILQTIADTNRKYSVPIITHEICELFDKLIESLPDNKKQLIIEYYGLKTDNPAYEKKSIAIIAKNANVGTERIRQIKEKALKYLRNNLKAYHIVNPSWETIHSLREDCKQKINANEKANEQHYLDLLLKNENDNDANLNSFVSESKQVFLQKISELNFSIRVLNVFKYSDIHNVYQLAQMDESELMKYKNMGINSIKEIQKILAANKIHLETKFSEKEKLYYEFMTRADKL